MYDFKVLREGVEGVETWLKNELSGVRTGIASPTILDQVTVESYGAQMPLNQVSTISAEGPRSIHVSPYDKGQIKEIEAAITKADLGVTVNSDDSGVRLNFPELTTENREEMVKTVKAKLEEARISLRQERDKVWGDIQKQEKDKEIDQDGKFRLKEEMQKKIDEAGNALELIAAKKEKELMS